MIPAIPLRDFYYDHLLKTRKKPLDSSSATSRKPAVRSGLGTRQATPNAPSKKDNAAASSQQGMTNDDQWLSSAFSAATLVGLTPSKIHNLGLEGKIRTRHKGGRIQYFRPDIEALRPKPKTVETVPQALPRVYSYPKLVEAAQRTGTSVNRVREMIRRGELAWDPTSEQILPPRKTSGKPTDGQPVKPDPSPADDGPGELAEPSIGGAHKPANLRQDKQKRNEVLIRELEQERTLRVESERWAEELQSDLDEQQARTLELEEAIRLFGPQRYEREEYEGRLAMLTAQLEEEQKRQRWTEERVVELQTRLEKSEADNKALREALSTEREKVGRMELERRLLDEIRRLLGAGRDETPLEGTTDLVSQEPMENGFVGAADTLLLQTPLGQVTFRPPFHLEDHEVDLLRLVAREDEITADQIRNLKGRRATNVLDDLLDRLLEAGFHPVKEINDRYSFDPSGLEAG